MQQRILVTLWSIAALGLAIPSSSTVAQQKSLKDQLVGTWALVSAVNTLPNGSKSEPWGANPKGVFVFDGNGRFAQILMRSDLPQLTDITRGTPEQNRALAQGSISMYGTYSVNQVDNLVTVHFEASTITSSLGADGRRNVRFVKADEIITTVPVTTDGLTAESVWKRLN